MRQSIAGNTRYTFSSLKELMAKASCEKSGDCLAGIAAASAQERVAARMALADAFAAVSSLTVGDFRNWLLADEVDAQTFVNSHRCTS